MDEKWALEFSEHELQKGRFPFHMDKLEKSGRPPYHWKTVFSGLHDDVCAELEKRCNALQVRYKGRPGNIARANIVIERL